jgi:hypothetical protein
LVSRVAVLTASEKVDVAPTQNPAPSFSSRRILPVDDDHHFLKLIAGVLAVSGKCGSNQ